MSPASNTRSSTAKRRRIWRPDARPAARAISDRAHAWSSALYRLTYGEVMPALAAPASGCALVRAGARRAALGEFFRDAVLPVLTPLAIDASRPFPLLSSLSLNLAVRLDAAPGETEQRLAIVQVPPGLARLVPLGGAGRRSCCSKRSSGAHPAVCSPASRFWSRQ